MRPIAGGFHYQHPHRPATGTDRLPASCSAGLQKCFVLAALVMVLGARTALAQSAEDPAPGSTVISLGAVSSPPKGQVMVPLFLTPGSRETQVGRFSATIRFSKEDLSFVRAEKGFLLDSVNATFRAEAADDSAHPGQAVVELEVSTRGDPPKALREGLVLSLVFRIQEKARQDTTATLEFDQITANAPGAGAAEVTPLATRQGTVEILRGDATPYVGCFFFTH